MENKYHYHICFKKHVLKFDTPLRAACTQSIS